MKKTKLLWLFLGLIVVVNLTIYLSRCCGEATLTLVGDLFPVICSLVSVLCLFTAVRKFREWDFTKVAWLMLFIGIVLYFIAEVTYGFLEIILKVDMAVVFPTLADYIWCIGYIPVFIGLIMMISGYRKSGFPMGNYKVYGIMGPLLLLLLSLVIIFLLVPIIKDTETTGIAKFFYLFYPIGDLFIVFPAIILVYITSLFGRGFISRPWKLLALGFIFFTVSDLLYSYLDWLGKYDTGNIIDVGWNIGYLLIGLGGIYQVEMIESLNEVR